MLSAQEIIARERDERQRQLTAPLMPGDADAPTPDDYLAHAVAALEVAYTALCGATRLDADFRRDIACAIQLAETRIRMRPEWRALGMAAVAGAMPT